MGKVFFGATDTPTITKDVDPIVIQSISVEPEIRFIEVPVEVIKEIVREVPVEIIKEVIVQVPFEVIKEVQIRVPVEVEKKVYVDRPYEITVYKDRVVHDIQAVLEEKQKVYKLEKSNKKLKILSVILGIIVIALGVTHG
jgi:hypothetical protein